MCYQGLLGPCGMCGSRAREMMSPRRAAASREGRGLCHSCGVPIGFRSPWISSPWSRSAITSPASSSRIGSPGRQRDESSVRERGWWGFGPAGTKTTESCSRGTWLRGLLAAAGDKTPRTQDVIEGEPADEQESAGAGSRPGVLRRPCPGCDSGVLQRSRSPEAQNLVKCGSCKGVWCWVCLRPVASYGAARGGENKQGGEGLGRGVDPHEHYSWWNIRGCPGARFTNPEASRSRPSSSRSHPLLFLQVCS